MTDKLSVAPFPPLMSIYQFCELTNTSRAEAYRLMEAGELRTVLQARRRKVRGEDAQQFIEALPEWKP